MIIRRGRLVLATFALVIGALVVATLSEDVRTMAAAQYQNVNPFDRRENAVFITLCRNQDLMGILNSIDSVESNFNHRYHYDWVFLNNEPWDRPVVASITRRVSGRARFGVIPEEHWSYPAWIDRDRAKAARKQMEEANVHYGGLESYRHMCRFESGFFFKHPLMRPYRYYWRVEPDIEIKCAVDYDVFTRMRQGEYKYGWTVAPKEDLDTVPSLWNATLAFLDKHPEYIAKDNLARFISNDDLKTYNLCHFWSNFEIADMKFWRSQVYQDYFNHLDHAGGFFYERWGDAPVHSIAVSLFMNQSQIHFFNDIGYFHWPYGHCPIDQGLSEIRCDCLPSTLEFSDTIYDWHKNSCVRDYLRAKKLPFVDGNPDMS